VEQNDPACRGKERSRRDRLVTDTTRKGNGVQPSAEIVVSASGRRRTATWQTSRLDRGCEAALANSYSIKKCVDSVELQTPKRYMQRCLTSLQRESRRSKTQRGNIRKFKIGFVRRRTSLRACFPQNRSKKLTRTVIWSFNFCYQGVESVCSRQANREKQAKTCVSSTMYVRLQARRKVLVPGCRDPCGRRAEETERYCGIDPGTRTL
jgi:hypothetical protein